MKAFNYFVLILGILIVAYGAAMKESLTLKVAAAGKNTPNSSDATNAATASAEANAAISALSLSASTANRYFAAGVALCGAIISLVFLLIEVRNLELVAYGRNWLDHLEGGLNMRVRRNDKDRLSLPSIVGLPKRLVTPFEDLITHKFGIRLIYLLGSAGFVIALLYAFNGFDFEIATALSFIRGDA